MEGGMDTGRRSKADGDEGKGYYDRLMKRELY